MRRIWIGADFVDLVHESGGTRRLCIPSTYLLDPIELEELILSEEEAFALDCKSRPEKKPLSKSDQKEMGKVLVQIKDSNRRRRETGHGKYW